MGRVGGTTSRPQSQKVFAPLGTVIQTRSLTWALSFCPESKMTTRFTALPVGQGDSFVVRRRHQSYLIDGGKSLKALPGILRKNLPELEYIDAVVCTHADADHANGLIGLLEGATLPINEVWLPGRWSEKLDQLLDDPAKFLFKVAQQLETQTRDVDRLCEIEPHRVETPKGERYTDSSIIADALEHFDDESLAWPAIVQICLPWPWIHTKRFLELIHTADRIARIASAAYHQGAKIRWFDFESAKKPRFSPVAPPGHQLVPCNSIEVARVAPNPRLSERDWLELTRANRESLVFLLPETASEPGALFTADSDLASPCRLGVSPQRAPLVTAPHHGSETNAAAYQVVKKWCQSSDPIYVRSDGNFKRNPGPTFLSSGSRRACTLCRSGGPKRAVELTVDQHNWVLNSQHCSC